MSRILFLFLLLLNLAPAQTAYLRLKTSAAWQVALNDRTMEIRGDTLLNLPAGEYRMLARPNGWQYWQNPIHREFLQLHPGDTTVVEFPLQRQTLLNSLPGDAFVRVGDSLQGKTPLVLNFSGQLLVSLSKTGFTRQEILLDGSQRQVLIRLEASSAALDKTNNFWRKHRRPLLLVATVSSNWLAFYLKRQADQAYDTYLRSGKINDMNREYELSQTLDGVSNVFLGISTASMLGFFYTIYQD